VLHGDVEGEVNPAPWRMVEARRLVLGGSAEKSRRASSRGSGSWESSEVREALTFFGLALDDLFRFAGVLRSRTTHSVRSSLF
jgi:hypothetical protein